MLLCSWYGSQASFLFFFFSNIYGVKFYLLSGSNLIIIFLFYQNNAHVIFLEFAVKLPELLFHANIDEETMMQMQAKLVDFLK